MPRERAEDLRQRLGTFAVDASVDASIDRASEADDSLPRLRPTSSRAWIVERPWLPILALVLVLSVPLIVAAVKLQSPRWYPVGDFAMTEIRVRDVASAHPPLIGLTGRIGYFGLNLGSHPGPLSFYALFPVWKLFGSSSSSLLWSVVALDIAAITSALWLAFRRGGVTMLFAVAAVLAVLMHKYGAHMLAVPWNPYLPVLWWLVFLISVWSVLDNDLAALPFAAFAGMFCVQTHISYVGLVGGLGAVTVAAVARRAYRCRNDEQTRRSWKRWVLVAALIVVVSCAPSLIDQLVHHPGNLSIILDYFAKPPSSAIGLHDGVRLLLQQLNPFQLTGSSIVGATGVAFAASASGSVVPGTLLVLAWVVSVVVAWRLRVQSLLSLDLVLGVGLLLGVISTARIFGYVSYYLLLWQWGLHVLMLLAVGWSIVAYASSKGRDLRPLGVVLPVVIVLATGSLTASATGVGADQPRENQQMAALVPPTVAAVRELQRAGQRGPYVITFDPAYSSEVLAEDMALLNELLRHGFDARLPIDFRAWATRYHVKARPERAPVQLHIASGPDIRYWRADPRYREIAYSDPRGDAERAEFDALRAEVLADLDKAGRGALKPLLDQNLDALLQANLPQSIVLRVSRMIFSLGFPAAIFIGPPGKPAGEP